jgi:hypothetical protein
VPARTLRLIVGAVGSVRWLAPLVAMAAALVIARLGHHQGNFLDDVAFGFTTLTIVAGAILAVWRSPPGDDDGGAGGGGRATGGHGYPLLTDDR